jgi:hypothetical protein
MSKFSLGEVSILFLTRALFEVPIEAISFLSKKVAENSNFLVFFDACDYEEFFSLVQPRHNVLIVSAMEGTKLHPWNTYASASRRSRAE